MNPWQEGNVALDRKGLVSKQMKGRNLKMDGGDKTIDRFLGEQRMISDLNDESSKIVDVKKDGNCLFRCFALALLENEDEHKEIRKSITEHMLHKENVYGRFVEGDYRRHVQMCEDTEWGTDAEIFATSALYDMDVYVNEKVKDKWEW